MIRQFLLALCFALSFAHPATRVRRGGFGWNPLGIQVPTENGPFGFNPMLGFNWASPPKLDFIFKIRNFLNIIFCIYKYSNNCSNNYYGSSQGYQSYSPNSVQQSPAYPNSAFGWGWQPLGLNIPTKMGPAIVNPSIGFNT